MPMINIADDAGTFVAASLLQMSETLDKSILAAGAVITPNQVVEDFKAATGKEAKLVPITYDQFKGFLPPPVAEELTENMKLIEDWYYAGEPKDGVQKSIDLVAKAGLKKPTTWKEFVAKNFQG